MLNILVNAYAVSPNWGSEPGMGWNWVTNLARYCHLDVITEGEWSREIDEALKSLPQRDNITFHYLPVPEKVRIMCWNQGDWRFYWYYRRWQHRSEAKAREIIASKHIDVLHQLNMIGFREPGNLWKIKGIPFVWGPVGGMDLMPVSYLQGAPLKQRLFNKLKNKLNKIQYKHSPLVRGAINNSSALISAVKGVQDVFEELYHQHSVLINETGVSIDSNIKKNKSIAGEPLKLIWVGKFDFRKQLPLALQSVIATGKRDIEIHICGTGDDAVIQDMKSIAEDGGIGKQCYWHGNVPHEKILEYMAQSDLLFFTSIMDATSTVVLEAISAGLPILCFNTCGFGPIVKDFAGITVDISNFEKSVNDFSGHLLNIYENRNILNDISSNILLNRDSLTWDSKARQMVEIYKSVKAHEK